jgi:hypothetical protein
MRGGWECWRSWATRRARNSCEWGGNGVIKLFRKEAHDVWHKNHEFTLGHPVLNLWCAGMRSSPARRPRSRMAAMGACRV